MRTTEKLQYIAEYLTADVMLCVEGCEEGKPGAEAALFQSLQRFSLFARASDAVLFLTEEDRHSDIPTNKR